MSGFVSFYFLRMLYVFSISCNSVPSSIIASSSFNFGNKGVISDIFMFSMNLLFNNETFV